MGLMSINDLQNINNIRQTHHYIRVNSPNINKEMSQEQSLFDMNPRNYSQQNSNELFLFPGSNSYDDDISSLFKQNGNLYI